MRGILKKICKFFSPPVDPAKMDIEVFIDFLKAINKKISLHSIETIYHVFSYMIYDDNYEKIKEELSTFESFQSYSIEKGDYVSANVVNLKNNRSFLILVRFTPDFNRKDYFVFSVSEFPKFSNDNSLIYQNRTYYSRLRPPVEPMFISDELLRKEKILE